MLESWERKNKLLLPKRVVVLESENILSAGIYSLLSANGHSKVVRVSFDQETCLDQVDQYEPEIIIMDETVLNQILGEYVTFLKNYPRMRTIVLSLGSNSVKVCDQQLIHVEHLNDFLDQI